MQQGKAVFTDIVVFRAQTDALLRFQSDGMISACGDGIVPSFAVLPDAPLRVILTKVCMYVCVCVCV